MGIPENQSGSTEGNMAAAHYKQQDHIRRVSARSFLTNISLDGSHRDTCYGKLVANRRQNVHVHATADIVLQDGRSGDQLAQPICPLTGRDLPEMGYHDLPTADSNPADGAAENKLQMSSESTLIRYIGYRIDID